MSFFIAFVFRNARLATERNIMKRKNPIKETVTHYIRATKKCDKKTPVTSVEFFEDLQNRGPFNPNSLFEKWTKKIRSDMEREGLWIKEDTNLVEFVIEYISRLQREFWDEYPGDFDKIDAIGTVFYRDFSDNKNLPRIFKLIYSKIRIWGLRMKIFGLCAWYRDVYLVTYIRVRQQDDELSLFTPWQMYWATKFSPGTINRAFFIEPHGLTVPWRTPVTRYPTWRT